MKKGFRRSVWTMLLVAVLMLAFAGVTEAKVKDKTGGGGGGQPVSPSTLFFD